MSAPLNTKKALELARTLCQADDMAGLEAALARVLPAAGAAGFAVLLADEEGEGLETALCAPGYSPSASRKFAELPEGARSAMESGRPVWPGDAGGTVFLPLAQAGVGFGLVELAGLADSGEDDRAVHELLAEELARMLVALEVREDLTSQLSETEAKLHALSEMGRQLNTLEFDVVAARFMSIALRASKAEVGALVLKDGPEWGESFEWGLDPGVALGITDADGRVAAQACLDDAKTVTVEAGSAKGIFAFVPLLSLDKPVGAAVLGRGPNEGDFTEHGLDLARSVASLAATAFANARFHAESLERERWRAAVAIAHEIQQGLMPDKGIQVEQLDVAFYAVASEKVGGDYVDILPQESGAMRVVVGDVAGHGVGSALLMTSTRAALRMLSRARTFDAALVRELNDFLITDVLTEGKFVTMFIGEINADTGFVRYVSAGHNPPIIIGLAGRARTTPGASGLPVGIVRNAEYTLEEEHIRVGEMLVIYTDGIIEARSPEGELFGCERLEQALSQKAGRAADVIENVKNAVAVFCRADSLQEDDQTLLVIKRKA